MLDLTGGAGIVYSGKNPVQAVTVRFDRRAMYLDIEGASSSETLKIALDGHVSRSPFEGTIVGASGRWETHETMLLELRNIRSAMGARLDTFITPERLSFKRRTTIPEHAGLNNTACTGLTLVRA